MNCRFCETPLIHTFIDLVAAPASNGYLSMDDLNKPEMYLPLKVLVCHKCWLVQTECPAEADVFFRPDYAYFSSTSSTWLVHAAEFCTMIRNRLQLGRESFIIEIASNDGYLLKNFIGDGIPCLGIEPTGSTADAAERLGIPVLRRFFNLDLAEQLHRDQKQADLIIGNNVYAHTPDIKGFTAGLKAALKPGGTITLEFPHIQHLIENVQFDTIYHEHYSYFSLYTVNTIFRAAGLKVFNVEELPTHGGSLRVYGCHGDDTRTIDPTVSSVMLLEEKMGLRNIDTYLGFQHKADLVKNTFLTFLIEQKNAGKAVAAYGAAAKGNTLLNYAGIKRDLIPYVCDEAPSKQGRFLPGSHIPILPPTVLKREKPDIVLILPWNIAGEIIRKYSHIYEWGGTFAVAVPRLDVLEVAR
jgi:hypothetical protein